MKILLPHRAHQCADQNWISLQAVAVAPLAAGGYGGVAAIADHPLAQLLAGDELHALLQQLAELVRLDLVPAVDNLHLAAVPPRSVQDDDDPPPLATVLLVDLPDAEALNVLEFQDQLLFSLRTQEEEALRAQQGDPVPHVEVAEVVLAGEPAAHHQGACGGVGDVVRADHPVGAVQGPTGSDLLDRRGAARPGRPLHAALDTNHDVRDAVRNPYDRFDEQTKKALPDAFSKA